MKGNNTDKLKSFVDDNKDGFNIFEPPSFEFTPSKKVEVEIKPNEAKKGIMIPLRSVMKVAAILAVIVGASYFWMYSTLKNENNSIAVTPVEEQIEQTELEPKTEFQLASISDEMAELEGYYIHQVSLKLGELRNLGIASEMEEELDVLDAEFNALKLDLGDDFDNITVINEMIKNYKLKLDLLQKVLDNMEELATETIVEKTEQNDEKYTIYY